MSTDAAQAETPRGGRRLRIALAVSVALNLALLGFLGGLALKGPPRPDGRPEGLGYYARALPESHRRDLVGELRSGRPDWGERRDALRQSHADLRAALLAEPFDAAAVSGALNRQRAAMGALAEHGAALLVEQISQMTPEERRDYAAALDRPHRSRDRDRER